MVKVNLENIRNYFNGITKEQINDVMNDPRDMVGLWFNTTNSGSVSMMSCVDDVEDEDVLSTGGVIIDKDNLLDLFKESGSLNSDFSEWL